MHSDFCLPALLSGAMSSINFPNLITCLRQKTLKLGRQEPGIREHPKKLKQSHRRVSVLYLQWGKLCYQSAESCLILSHFFGLF